MAVLTTALNRLAVAAIFGGPHDPDSPGSPCGPQLDIFCVPTGSRNVGLGSLGGHRSAADCRT